MSRRKKDPLRPLTDDESATLTQLSRSQAAPAAQVARATLLLAGARGDDYPQAARAAGRRSGDAVSHLVARPLAEADLRDPALVATLDAFARAARPLLRCGWSALDASDAAAPSHP